MDKRRTLSNERRRKPANLMLTFPGVISTRKKIEQRLLEGSVVYRKIGLAEYVNLQMLKHCFVS